VTEIDSIHAPLLRQMGALAGANGGRAVVFLAGPPASGKSMLAARWEELARTLPAAAAVVQALPLDGFHYHSTILDSRTCLRGGERVSLRRIKGAPESYDLEGLAALLAEIDAGRSPAWPRYDRALHEPVPAAIPVIARGVLVVEGNYLLLDEPGWRDLARFKDLGIFIECDEETARRDILDRHCRGGRPLADALRHYEFNDVPNRQRIMSARQGVDVLLRYDAGRRLERVR
jgi:pantothenate kinase